MTETAGTNTNAPAILEVDGAIAHLRINRPSKRNALSLDALELLNEHVNELKGVAGRPGGVSVVVLSGDGPAFCAGMDLKQVLDEEGGPLKLLALIAQFTIGLAELPAVVIAKVHGAAIGGGCGLACACDISVTHPEAKLGFPEVDLGLCPAVVAPWVVRQVGAGVARRVLLTGGTMSGLEAHGLGLVSRCVPKAELDGEVEQLAVHIAGGGHAALGATKRLLNELESGDGGGQIVEAVRAGAQVSADVIGGDEAQGRLRARMNR